MARVSGAVSKTTAATANSLICQLRMPSTRDFRLWEIDITNVSGVACEVGLNRPTAVGATFTSTATAFEDSTPGGTPQAVIDTVTGTAPTLASTYYRRYQLPASVGAGVVISFQFGLVIPQALSIALIQLSASAVTLDVNFVGDE